MLVGLFAVYLRGVLNVYNGDISEDISSGEQDVKTGVVPGKSSENWTFGHPQVKYYPTYFTKLPSSKSGLEKTYLISFWQNPFTLQILQTDFTLKHENFTFR